MKDFPSTLNPKNIRTFPDIYYRRVLCYLRKSIYEHIISNDENSYFDIEKFSRQYCSQFLTNEKLRDKLCESIIPELMSIGWKCKVSFGGTALFIYSSENPPPSCWDDGL